MEGHLCQEAVGKPQRSFLKYSQNHNLILPLSGTLVVCRNKHCQLHEIMFVFTKLKGNYYGYRIELSLYSAHQSAR